MGPAIFTVTGPACWSTEACWESCSGGSTLPLLSSSSNGSRWEKTAMRSVEQDGVWGYDLEKFSSSEAAGLRYEKISLLSDQFCDMLHAYLQLLTGIYCTMTRGFGAKTGR